MKETECYKSLNQCHAGLKNYVFLYILSLHFVIHYFLVWAYLDTPNLKILFFIFNVIENRIDNQEQAGSCFCC